MLAAFAAWTTLSAAWGAPGAALRVAPLALLYAGVHYTAEQVEPARLVRALRVSILLVVLAAIAARVADASFAMGGGPESERLAWPVSYANGLGLVAVFGLVLWIGIASRERRVAVVATVACAATAVLTLSRSALLVGLAALLLLGARRVIRKRTGRVAVAVASVAVAAVAIAAASPLAARFAAPAPDERDARRLLDVSGHGRAELWRVAWHEGLDHPVAGAGAGTWARAYVDRTGSLAGPANAHSLYLETFAELGLVGVALVLAFFGVVVRAGIGRDEEWATPALAVVAAYAVHAAADWDWQLPAATLPVVVASAALLARPSRALRRGAVALAALALAVGAAAGAHGVGAALVETDARPALAQRLLPFDARPAVVDRDRRAACRVDPGEPMLARAYPPDGGCPNVR